MTHRNKGGSWRYEIVAGTHRNAAWVELREQYIDADGQKLGHTNINTAETIEELIDDLRAQLATAETHKQQQEAQHE